jgi:hypothetical protein
MTVGQYSMLGKPQQNGVVERCNCTLMNIVRSMISYSTLLISLWMEALKTAIHILNQDSSNYHRVWGCTAEANIFNPNVGKLESKTVSYHFFGYPEKSKGFRFHCPDRHTMFVEMRHVIFLEDKMMRGSTVPQEISIEEKRSTCSLL